MCVSNELCSEIAMALLLARGKTDLEITRLREILIEVHAVMQRMAEVERVGRRRSRNNRELDDGSDRSRF